MQDNRRPEPSDDVEQFKDELEEFIDEHGDLVNRPTRAHVLRLYADRVEMGEE